MSIIVGSPNFVLSKKQAPQVKSKHLTKSNEALSRRGDPIVYHLRL